MKFQFLAILICFLLGSILNAQVDEIPTQAEIDAMMKEAEQEIKKAMEELSPEDRKMMEEVMANSNAGNTGMSKPSNSNLNTQIPKKQTEVLGKIPKLSTTEQYKGFVEKMIAQTNSSIDEKIRKEVEMLLSQNHSKEQLNNLPPFLLMKKNPKAAVYAALLVANTNQDFLVSQNNLAVILHQTGYPQYALPLLEFLISKHQNAVLYNNAGQCYLSLGDTQKSEDFFAMAIQLDPENHEAHCGTAMILIEQGKIPQAIPHLEQAMKIGYSPILDKLIHDKNIDLDFEKLKPDVPEYFNPNKYKLPIGTKTLNEVKPTLAKRQEIEDLMYAWGEKNQEFDEKHAEKISNESMMEISKRTYGITGNPPFSQKAMFMLNQIQKEVLDMAIRNFSSNDPKSISEAKSLSEKLEQNIRKRYDRDSYESTYDECVMLREETEIYLKESAALYDSKVQKTAFKYYDITNQQLFWYQFLLNSDGYEHMFYGVAAEFFTHLDDYKKYQILYPKAEWVVDHCEKILANPPKKVIVIEKAPDLNCPVKVKVNSGPLNLKLDCKGWEIEGGELVIVGVQKDYTTGELTVAFGVGANAGILGAKGQMFFKFDGEGNPIDCGMVFEAGAEVGAGPIVIEEKANATIGMVSGINVKGTAGGQDIEIFKLEP